MSDFPENAPLPAGAELPPPRAQTELNAILALLAWVVVIVLVCLTVESNSSGRVHFPQPPAKTGKAEAPPEPNEGAARQGEAAEPPADQTLSANDPIGSFLMLFEVRNALGFEPYLSEGDRKTLYDQLKLLNGGTLARRFRFIVFAGEIQGPAEALARLEELKEFLKQVQQQDGRRPSPQQLQVLDALERLYEDYDQGRWDAPHLGPEDRELLRKELDWFSELALSPAQGDAGARAAVVATGHRTMTAIVAVLVWAGFFLFVGSIAWLVLGGLWLVGWVKGRLRCPTGNGGVYAETFAVWLVLFLGLRYALGFIDAGPYHYLLGIGQFLFSLVALAWPVLRGVPWQKVREDIGLTLGKGVLRESFAGVTVYALAVPLAACGFVIVGLLLLAGMGTNLPLAGFAGPDFDPVRFPMHPAAGQLPQVGWLEQVQLYVLGCLVAPLVEETMFRGVLHRHLREISSWAATVVSVLFSAVLASFVFAIIHPQGPVAAPALMALACGFSLGREWRGSLLPGMVAHGLNNAVVFTFVFFALGS
jgi:membrane protease YdiL (CAAX protease family)